MLYSPAAASVPLLLTGLYTLHSGLLFAILHYAVLRLGVELCRYLLGKIGDGIVLEDIIYTGEIAYDLLRMRVEQPRNSRRMGIKLCHWY